MATRRAFLFKAGAFVGALFLPKVPDIAPLEEKPALALVETPVGSGDFFVERRGAAELVASGGLCAPVTPYYDLNMVTGHHPVRDALPKFSAVNNVVPMPKHLHDEITAG